jgi:hypothetical protein
MPVRLSAEHWRARATEARALAEQFADEDSRRRMMRIALEYDKLGDKVEFRDALAAGDDD